MLRQCSPQLAKMLQTPTNWTRVVARRNELERRRIQDSCWRIPPVEPTTEQAVALYRALLKEGNRTLVLTDKEFFKRKVRHEFEVTARQTSSRVRGMMFEKGQWMIKSKLGGLV